jgi:hypothetical protein
LNVAARFAADADVMEIQWWEEAAWRLATAEREGAAPDTWSAEAGYGEKIW